MTAVFIKKNKIKNTFHSSNVNVQAGNVLVLKRNSELMMVGNQHCSHLTVKHSHLSETNAAEQLLAGQSIGQIKCV